jgi:hypothetical protein
MAADTALSKSLSRQTAILKDHMTISRLALFGKPGATLLRRVESAIGRAWVLAPLAFDDRRIFRPAPVPANDRGM